MSSWSFGRSCPSRGAPLSSVCPRTLSSERSGADCSARSTWTAISLWTSCTTPLTSFASWLRAKPLLFPPPEAPPRDLCMACPSECPPPTSFLRTRATFRTRCSRPAATRSALSRRRLPLRSDRATRWSRTRSRCRSWRRLDDACSTCSPWRWSSTSTSSRRTGRRLHSCDRRSSSGRRRTRSVGTAPARPPSARRRRRRRRRRPSCRRRRLQHRPRRTRALHRPPRSRSHPPRRRRLNLRCRPRERRRRRRAPRHGPATRPRLTRVPRPSRPGASETTTTSCPAETANSALARRVHRRAAPTTDPETQRTPPPPRRRRRR
mmetsp:Transcript_28564/g.61728  ORF Transcript_28564/g.61728 Transcript_28564/m.61728 type:complete len:321 (-) Transcript_28564:2018-2980(-)